MSDYEHMISNYLIFFLLYSFFLSFFLFVCLFVLVISTKHITVGLLVINTHPSFFNTVYLSRPLSVHNY